MRPASGAFIGPAFGPIVGSLAASALLFGGVSCSTDPAVRGTAPDASAVAATTVGSAAARPKGVSSRNKGETSSDPKSASASTTSPAEIAPAHPSPGSVAGGADENTNSNSPSGASEDVELSKTTGPLRPGGPRSPFEARIASGAGDHWTGVAEEDPLLVVYSVDRVRFAGPTHSVSKIPARKDTLAGTCAAALSALDDRPIGSREGMKVWEGIAGKELDTITGCVSFPCQVKLNAPEVAVLVQSPKASRREKYLALVDARTREAHRTGKRMGYERAENAIDGWAWVDAHAAFGIERPTAPGTLTARRLDLAKKLGGYLEVRQTLEERVSATPTRFHRWLRDLYTDHYFDGWSEEVDFYCVSPEEGVLTQTAVIEIDLLKNTDFFSKLMKPKLRHGVRENVLKMMRDRGDAWMRAGTGAPSK